MGVDQVVLHEVLQQAKAVQDGLGGGFCRSAYRGLLQHHGCQHYKQLAEGCVYLEVINGGGRPALVVGQVVHRQDPPGRVQELGGAPQRPHRCAVVPVATIVLMAGLRPWPTRAS